MNTSIVLALDSHKRSDGTYPVVLRITHHQKVAQIIIGVNLKQDDWDAKLRKVRNSFRGSQSVTRLNNYLQKKKTEATDKITKLDEKKTLDSFSVVQLKRIIEGASESGSFFEYAEKLISDFLEAKRYGNARTYKGTLSVLKTFTHGRDVSFRDLNYDFLVRFEQDNLQKGNSVNGLSVYLRTIRAIFNKAIKSGLTEQEFYPFKMYEIKGSKTRKRAISMEAIKRIQALELGPTHPLFHARNYFLASFYLRGISFTDLAHLKVSDIIDGRIHYDRQKTDKPYDIVITPPMQTILDVYVSGKEKKDFIFPFIHRETEQEQYVEVQDARKRFNKKLKKIAELCGIEENLTSYVSRHSFATRAKLIGIPIATISDMLGHSSTSTTEVYLDSLPSDILDDFHRKVIE